MRHQKSIKARLARTLSYRTPGKVPTVIEAGTEVEVILLPASCEVSTVSEEDPGSWTLVPSQGEEGDTFAFFHNNRCFMADVDDIVIESLCKSAA